MSPREDLGREFAKRLYDVQDEASLGRYVPEVVDGLATGRLHWVPGNPGPTGVEKPMPCPNCGKPTCEHDSQYCETIGCRACRGEGSCGWSHCYPVGDNPKAPTTPKVVAAARALASDSSTSPGVSCEQAHAMIDESFDILTRPVSLDEAISAQFNALEALFWDRQRKYGPGNIAEFGDYGILVRLYDKLARLRRYYVEGVGDMPDESVRDAWADVAVYATIALVCMDGQWPGWTPRKGPGREHA